MVIVTNAGKRQQFIAIGDRHCADIQFLIQHLGHLHAVHFVKALTKDTLRGGRYFQRGGGKRRGVFFKHGAFVEQNAHKQRRPDGVSHHHGRGNTAYQMQRIFKRSGDQQNDQHLHQFSDEGNRPGR